MKGDDLMYCTPEVMLNAFLAMLPLCYALFIRSNDEGCISDTDLLSMHGSDAKYTLSRIQF